MSDIEMSIQLILCDWEGCVTEPGGGRIPWPIHNIAKLNDVISIMRSISDCPPFALCTGRQFPYGEAALQAIGAMWDDIPSILENGSGLYYPTTKKILWHPGITSSVGKAMIEIRSHVIKMIENMKGEIERGKEYCISVNPPTGKNIEWLYEYMKEQLKSYDDVIEITHSLSAVDITLRGVNKGSATQFLSEVTGISLEHIVGIGDSSGDLPMLRLVGHPAGPSNADPKVQKITEYISPLRTTDGVIDIIQHYLELNGTPISLEQFVSESSLSFDMINLNQHN
ncbi:MAG: HAD family hydrolase [Proteobacteria bacterium]|nr:HAD family hydrolase [Pseudomonadota bacterium]